MFCNECGTQLSDDTQLYPNCGKEVASTRILSERGRQMKKIITALLISTLTLSITACGKETCSISGCSNEVYKDGLCPEHYVAFQTGDEELQTTEDISDSTDESAKIEESQVDNEINLSFLDEEVGLRTIRVDSSNSKLTDEQKQLIQYFDHDYYRYDREFFERYANDFIGCKVMVYVTVEKIVDQSANSFEFIASESMKNTIDPVDFGSPFTYIKCTNPEYNYLPGDTLLIFGTYTGFETIQIDGETYSLGVIEAFPKSHLLNADNYTYDQMKSFAEELFGKDIKLVQDDGDYYKVTFENQSNSNFSKVLMNSSVNAVYGSPIQAFDSDDNPYDIIVASDFEHLYYFYTEPSTNETRLAYYDKDFKKIWQREFENVENISYDYTSTYFYTVVNGYLYIIDCNTGEDVKEPILVGNQSDVRKTTDGLFLAKESPAGEDTKVDVVSKCDNESNELWKASLDKDYSQMLDFQLIDDSLLFQYSDSSGEVYVAILDTETGTVKKTCQLLSTELTTYSSNDSSDLKLDYASYINSDRTMLIEVSSENDVGYCLFLTTTETEYMAIDVRWLPTQMTQYPDGHIEAWTDDGTKISFSYGQTEMEISNSPLQWGGEYDINGQYAIIN